MNKTKKLITPMKMEPYPGWRFIENDDGSIEHIPTHEWLNDILSKFGLLALYAKECEYRVRSYRNESPDSPSDQSIIDAEEILKDVNK